MTRYPEVVVSTREIQLPLKEMDVWILILLIAWEPVRIP
jgi:hypothetical protein